MYDRQELFKKHIQKKAEEINELCKTFGIVSFMSFCIKDNDKKTEYKNYICGSTSNGVHLADDQIRGHVNVANGFLTVPQTQETGMDDYMSDIDD